MSAMNISTEERYVYEVQKRMTEVAYLFPPNLVKLLEALLNEAHAAGVVSGSEQLYKAYNAHRLGTGPLEENVR